MIARGAALRGRHIFKTTLILLILVSGLLVLGTSGTPQDHSQPINSGRPRSKPQDTPLSIDDIIKMVKAGFSDDTIILQIKKKAQPFNLSADQMIQLKSASISERVIRAMIDPASAEVATPGDKTPPTPQQMPATVVASQDKLPMLSALQGINVQDLTPEGRQRHYKGFWAVAITSIQPSSPAYSAGIRPGDIIQSIVIGGEPRPVPTGTPVEFMYAVKRCVPSCLIEITREGENTTGFLSTGDAETAFVSVYGQASKALLAYRDVRTQKLYAAQTRNIKIPDEDMKALASEPSGLITRTVSGEKLRTAPVTIGYKPKGLDDPKPWYVRTGTEDESPVGGKTVGKEVKEALAPLSGQTGTTTLSGGPTLGAGRRELAGTSSIQDVPSSSALWGVRVKVVTMTPNEAALQFGMSRTADIQLVLVEEIDSRRRAGEGDLHTGEAINYVYVAGSQPYVKGWGGSSINNPDAFYRKAELCVPDCLAMVRDGRQPGETLLWLHSMANPTQNGLLADNFQIGRRPDSTVAYTDVRSKVSYEPAKGGGVIFRDGDTGKLLGATVTDKATAEAVAQEMRSQATSTAARGNPGRVLSPEQIKAPVHQEVTNPGEPQGLVLAGAGHEALARRRLELTSQMAALAEQMHREQGAAQAAEAEVQQNKDYSRENSSNTALNGMARGIADAAAASSARSAAAHRQRQQQLKLNLQLLDQQLRTVEAELGVVRSPVGTPAWKQEFLLGDLAVSPGHVTYEHRDAAGRLDELSFEANCSDLKEWKENRGNFANLFARSNQQYWTFHVKMKSGANHNVTADSEDQVTSALQGISTACK